MNKVGAKGATRKLGKLLDQFSSQSLGEANESLVKSQSVLPLIRVS
jgi:hypothetical protein